MINMNSGNTAIWSFDLDKVRSVWIVKDHFVRTRPMPLVSATDTFLSFIKRPPDIYQLSGECWHFPSRIFFLAKGFLGSRMIGPGIWVDRHKDVSVGNRMPGGHQSR
jgi:hypothetical protein